MIDLNSLECIIKSDFLCEIVSGNQNFCDKDRSFLYCKKTISQKNCDIIVKAFITFFEILVFIKGLDFVIFAQAGKGVNKMGTEVGVDILRAKLGGSLAIDRPISVITYNSSIVHLSFDQMMLGGLLGF